MITIYGEKMKTFRYGILPFLIVLGVISGLMVLEPHLSGTILILTIGIVMMFVGGVDLKWSIGWILSPIHRAWGFKPFNRYWPLDPAA